MLVPSALVAAFAGCAPSPPIAAACSIATESARGGTRFVWSIVMTDRTRRAVSVVRIGMQDASHAHGPFAARFVGGMIDDWRGDLQPGASERVRLRSEPGTRRPSLLSSVPSPLRCRAVAALYADGGSWVAWDGVTLPPRVAPPPDRLTRPSRQPPG